MQFVEKDIEEVMQGKEFETLNDSQKEQVITELHNRWSDPGSEIVRQQKKGILGVTSRYVIVLGQQGSE
ncbi:MAG: hypothetical protein KKD21_04860 [Proteobacteria bacterium]|nr:hypothetical protein [Pseudomonadota bacterium]MBU1696362.1 hypothetical protein [Pseudomonadota bacterium]